MPPTPAIVLAAGASSRMGSVKALLRIDGTPVIDLVCRTLKDGGANPVYAVLGCHRAHVIDEATLDGILVIPHVGWQLGRTSSIQAGLRMVDQPLAERFMLALVDMPYVEAQTVSDLLQAAESKEIVADVIVPTYEGRRGHPVVIEAALFPQIHALGPDQPLHEVIREARTHEVPVDDPGVLHDINTPEDVRS